MGDERVVGDVNMYGYRVMCCWGVYDIGLLVGGGGCCRFEL